MSKKHIFTIIWCVVMIIPITTLILVNSLTTPALYYSFENGFENELVPGTALLSYGNMAFSDNAPKGKGLSLENGFLNVKKSNKFRLDKTFSFSGWLKFESLDAETPMFLSRASENGDPYNGPFSISFSEDYTGLLCSLTFRMNDGTEKTHVFESGTLFSRNRLMRKWNHLAVTFNESYLCFYTDGELRSTISLPKDFGDIKSIKNTDRYFSIGRCLDTNMNANLDEIRFSTTAYDYNKIAEFYSEAKSQSDTEILLTEGDMTAKINGQEFSLSTPLITDEQTEEFLVPAKSVLSKIGGTLLFDETDGFGRADIKIGQNEVSVWAYDTHAIVNGGYHKLPTHPRLTEDNILLIPSSLFSDVFGADVEFKEGISSLSILY